jgi:hypothetical protein
MFHIMVVIVGFDFIPLSFILLAFLSTILHFKLQVIWNSKYFNNSVLQYFSINIQAGKIALRSAQASGLLRRYVAQSHVAAIFHSFPLMTTRPTSSFSVTKHWLAISCIDQPSAVLL